MVIYLLLVFFMFPGYRCLKNVTLRAPEAVREGQNIVLICDFTLEREELYSVKFYHGDAELYQHMPGYESKTSFKGIAVERSTKTNGFSVALPHVHRNMTGNYKCEVNTGQPSFQSVVVSAFVTVTEAPLTPPLLIAEKRNYGLGEKIQANCSYQGGFPLSNLTWYINNIQVNQSTSTYIIYEELNVNSSISKLEQEVTPNLFQYGLMLLRCDATQFSLYRRSAELVIRDDTPQDSSPLNLCGTESVDNTLMSVDDTDESIMPESEESTPSSATSSGKNKCSKKVVSYTKVFYETRIKYIKAEHVKKMQVFEEELSYWREMRQALPRTSQLSNCPLPTEQDREAKSV